MSTKHQPAKPAPEPPPSHDPCDGHGAHGNPKPAPDGGFDGIGAKVALQIGGDGPHVAFGATLSGDGPPAGGADLSLLGALAHGASGLGFGGEFDTQSYDGHVALTLDAGCLPDIDATLDALTSSHLLFDVPALDVGCLDDALPT